MRKLSLAVVLACLPITPLRAQGERTGDFDYWSSRSAGPPVGAPSPAMHGATINAVRAMILVSPHMAPGHGTKVACPATADPTSTG